MKEASKQLVLGIAGTGSGVAISLSNVELWLRLASLSLGIFIGCLSAYSIWLTIQRKRRRRLLEEKEPETDI